MDIPILGCGVTSLAEACYLTELRVRGRLDSTLLDLTMRLICSPARRFAPESALAQDRSDHGSSRVYYKAFFRHTMHTRAIILWVSHPPDHPRARCPSTASPACGAPASPEVPALH